MVNVQLILYIRETETRDISVHYEKQMNIIFAFSKLFFV